MCNMCLSRRKFISLASIAVASSALPACTTNPVTGRKQLLLVSDSQILSLVDQEWQNIVNSIPPSNNQKNIQSVQRVGKEIARASGIKENWEFRVFARDETNAFVMPGGKVAVFDGMFKAAQNDHQLAAVLGHEVGHISGKHVKERYSQQLLSNSILSALYQSNQINSTTTAIAGLGVGLVILLPFSRKQETEADIIGIKYMKKAGYNIQEAVNLWRNMAEINKSNVPQFLSTHPSSSQRIRDLQEEIQKIKNS